MPSLSAIDYRQVRVPSTLAALVWMAAAMGTPSAQAQTYTVLHTFVGGAGDGENPESRLFMDKSGNLFGTTVLGPGCNPTACAPLPGMVFKISSTGVETILYGFAGNPDGANPYAGVILDTSNSAYGTTRAGGTSNMGTVFKMAATGETVVHSFAGPPNDGAFPYAGVSEDSAGNLYGVTSAGGASNNGAVFKIAPTGTETLLYSFTGGADGGSPYGGVLRTSSGYLFGTTYAGGTTSGNCFPSGCGVVFVVTPAGKEHVLHRFTGSPDGASPYASLIADSAGNIYGTTYNGGTGLCTNGCGTVFQVNTSGAETVLYSFQGSPTDGAFPLAGLARDSAGNFYGTTTYGGASESGVVFELAATGAETVLYSFLGTTDGATPRAGLILDSAGNLYGTTYNGGKTGAACGGEPANTCGVVFKLKP